MTMMTTELLTMDRGGTTVGDATGVDIGGTSVRVTRVARDGTHGAVARADTPFGDAAGLVDVVAELHGGADGPVGVGVAGGATSDGVLCGAPNLGIDGAPFGRMLEERLGRPVTVTNDADAATWAEHRLGAGRGVDDLVMLTLGTGVGGGAVIGGRLLRGSSGLAAEFGHIVLAEGGAACACGNHGCLEAYASGSAMAMGDRRASDLAADAADGDSVAAAHLARIGFWLGVGLADLVNALDPALLVIGGGAGTAAFDALAPAAEEALAARLFGRQHRTQPPLVRAGLGDDAGVIGAALLALQTAEDGS